MDKKPKSLFFHISSTHGHLVWITKENQFYNIKINSINHIKIIKIRIEYAHGMIII